MKKSLPFSFFLFMFFFRCTFAGQSSNFTLDPYESVTFTCSMNDRKFEIYVDSKEFYEALLQKTYTFSLRQTSLGLNTSNQSSQINESFRLSIDYLFSNGDKSSIKYEKSYDAPNIINYQFNAEKGIFYLVFDCADTETSDLEQMRLTFFPGNIKLKPVEFDSQYQLINVPGYFSGTYSYYETYLIFAIFNLGKEKPDLLIKIDDCIGDVSLMHFKSNELDEYLRNKATNSSNKIFSDLNGSNTFIIKLHPILNYFVIQANTGVIFQYGMPSKAMVRISSKSIDVIEGNQPPYLKSTSINFNYRFPEVFLNFSKIFHNDRMNLSINDSKSLNDTKFLNNSNDTEEGNRTNDNHTNITNPIQYKIIIAQSYLFLSIVSKCGLDVFETIPKNGNFQNINTYYKEIAVDHFKNLSNLDFSQEFQNKNETFDNNQTIPSNETKNDGGFLMKNETNNNFSNSTSNQSQLLDNSSEFANLKPFTLYDHGNNFKLKVNLDTKDYYFITAIAYLPELNGSYFFYDPILIKDNRYADEKGVDVGLVFITIGAIVFSLIMIFCFYKCMKKYIKNTKSNKKENKKKNKFSDQQKILFGKQNNSINEKLKADRINQMLGPSDIKIAKF